MSASAPIGQHAGLDPQQRRRIGGEQLERAGQVDHAVAHQRQRQRQQRFGPRHARRGIGERQALVLRPARIVARWRSRRSCRRRCAASTAWRSSSPRSGGERRAKVRKSASRQVGQHEMRRGHAGGDAHAARLGGAHQMRAPARGRHLAQMQPRAAHLGQRDVARDGQRLGLGGRARQARAGSPSRPPSPTALPASPPSSAWLTTTRSSIAAYCSSRSITPAIGDPAPPGGDRRARRHRASARVSASCVALQPDASPRRAGGPTGRACRSCAAKRTRAGWSSGGSLVGHQRRAGDPAEVERRLVDREDAEIDQPGRDQRAPGIDHLVAVLRGDRRPARRCGRPRSAARPCAHAVGQ